MIYNNVPPPISDDVVSKKQATKLPETVTPEKDVAIQELGGLHPIDSDFRFCVFETFILARMFF